MLLFVLVLLLLDALFVGFLPTALRAAVRTGYLGSHHGLPGRPSGRLHIAIITRLDSDQGHTRSNFAAYCNRHGYNLVVLNDYNEHLRIESGFAMRPFGAIKRVMQAPAFLDYKLYDWVMWADADTVFLNHGIPLERIIDNRYSFIVPSPLPEDADAVPSLSHFLVRNSPEGRQILDDLDKRSQEHCGQFIVEFPGAATALNGWLHVCNADGTFWNGDRGLLLAVLTFASPEYRCRFKRVAHRVIDSQFPAYADGDLALSFPDYMVAHRKKLVSMITDRADYKRGRILSRDTANGQLDPVDPGLGDWQALEALYDAHLNVPCQDL